MKTVSHFIITLALAFTLASCNSNAPKSIIGWEPVYVSTATLHAIAIHEPRSTQSAGRIYKYGNQYSFQIDNGNGIHVIDNSNPALAQKIKFIQIPGVADLSIRNGILYTNNAQDLVAISLQNMQDLKIINRIEQIFPGVSQHVPPETNAWFICPDPQKGTVVRWEKKMIHNPTCKAQ